MYYSSLYFSRYILRYIQLLLTFESIAITDLPYDDVNRYVVFTGNNAIMQYYKINLNVLNISLCLKYNIRKSCKTIQIN